MSKAKDKPKVRCAIYTRKSTDENLDLDFNSLDAQREAGEAYIQSQQHEGWVCLADRYDDGGFSGGNLDRPAFQRLMEDVKAGRLDCIVVYKIDRLSRSLMDFAGIMQTLEAHQVSVVSVTQQFNTTSSMGRLTLNILLSFAQFEREIISERTRDKIAAARRKGKWTGGPPVLGYDRVRDNRGTRIKVNKDEAELVRAIYRMYLEEGSLLATLRALKAKDWKTKQYQTVKGRSRGGTNFDKPALHKLLTNVVYTGKVTYKEEIHDGEHTAIVDENLFAQVQDLMQRNRNSGGTHSRNKSGALLKGLVRCKACGCSMGHHFSTRRDVRYRYYVCLGAQKNGWDTCRTPSLPAKQLESFVVQQIKELGHDPDVLADTLRATQDGIQRQVDELQDRHAAMEKDIKSLSRQIGEVAAHAGGDEHVPSQIEKLQDTIRQRQREAVELATQVEKVRGRGRGRMLESDELTGALEAFDPLWETMSPTEQAKLIHLLVERVEYDGENETIALTFHPTGIRTFAQDSSSKEPLCQMV